MIDETDTRSPPTLWTMSAKTVVVVTTLSVVTAGGPPLPPELHAETPTPLPAGQARTLRPSLATGRECMATFLFDSRWTRPRPWLARDGSRDRPGTSRRARAGARPPGTQSGERSR